MGIMKSNKNLHLINHQITSNKIIIVGEYSSNNKILSNSEAMKIADDLNLDLVLFNLDSNGIAICKIMDYQKFLYDKNKNEKKPQKVVVKEIRINPYIDTNDFQRKIKQAYEFLGKGFKVKLDSLIGKGRTFENTKINVLEMVNTLINEVEEVGIVETPPSFIGQKMNCVIRPKKR